jgi:hypothetical protein
MTTGRMLAGAVSSTAFARLRPGLDGPVDQRRMTTPAECWWKARGSFGLRTRAASGERGCGSGAYRYRAQKKKH